MKGNALLGDVIFHHALPFALVESEKFAKFLAFVSPGFKFVSEETIAGPVLDKAHAKTVLQVTKKLQEQGSVTLGCDGSSDGCSDPITHVVALTRDCPPFLLREVPHLEEKHSVKNILKLLDEDVKSLEIV